MSERSEKHPIHPADRLAQLRGALKELDRLEAFSTLRRGATIAGIAGQEGVDPGPILDVHQNAADRLGTHNQGTATSE